MGILSAPFRGLLRVFDEVAAQAEREMYDDGAVRAELSALYLKLESHAITEEEFDAREAELVQRLEEIEAHQQQRGEHDSP